MGDVFVTDAVEYLLRGPRAVRGPRIWIVKVYAAVLASSLSWQWMHRMDVGRA